MDTFPLSLQWKPEGWNPRKTPFGFSPQTNATQCSYSAGLAHIILLNFQAFLWATSEHLIAWNHPWWGRGSIYTRKETGKLVSATNQVSRLLNMPLDITMGGACIRKHPPVHLSHLSGTSFTLLTSPIAGLSGLSLKSFALAGPVWSSLLLHLYVACSFSSDPQQNTTPSGTPSLTIRHKEDPSYSLSCCPLSVSS